MVFAKGSSATTMLTVDYEVKCISEYAFGKPEKSIDTAFCEKCVE